MAATRPHRPTAGPLPGDRPAPASAWSLEVRAGEDEIARVVEVGLDPIQIGRGIRCEVRLNQVGLGDVQCILRRRGDEWTVQPVGPPGRIWIDERPIDQLRPLPAGALLRVGRATLTLHESDPDRRDRGSFDAPITIEVPAEVVVVEPAAAIEPLAPAEPPAATSTPPVDPTVEPTLEPPGGPTEAADDRARRWQARLDQRDQWLRDRQSEKRWEARWKAAGENLRARSATPSPAPAPAPGRPEPVVPPPSPSPATSARVAPGRAIPPRTFEPRPVFGHARRPPAPELRPEPSRPEVIPPAEPPPRAAGPIARGFPEAPAPGMEPGSAPLGEETRDDAITPIDRPAPTLAELPAARPLAEFEDVDAVLAEVLPPPVPIAPSTRPAAIEPRAEVEAAPEDSARPAPIAPPPSDPPVIAAEPSRALRTIAGAPSVVAPPTGDSTPSSAGSAAEVAASRPTAPQPTRLRSIRSPARPRPPVAPPADSSAPGSSSSLVAPARPPIGRQEAGSGAGTSPPSAGSAGPETGPVAAEAAAKEWPSARSIFAAQGTRPTGAAGAEPAAPDPTAEREAGISLRPRRTPEPTAATRPEAWTIPLLLGWVPAALLVAAGGLLGVGLAAAWIEEGASGNTALRLATRPEGAPSPAIDAQAIPKSAWWQTTAAHLAAWAIVLERVGAGEDRAADARILEGDARSVSPLGARARFAIEPVAGQDADGSTSIRLGPTRDIVTLTAMAHRLRREGKRVDAIRAYHAAFETAATTARANLGRPLFRSDPAVSRYALPHSSLLDDVARDMAASGEWAPEEWAEATPDFAPALLAVAAALRAKDPADSDRRLEAIARRPDQPPDRRYEASEERAAVAEALAERGRWTDAVAQYRQAVDAETRDLDRRVWWFNLAEVARKAGDDLMRRQAIEAAKGTDLSDEVTQRAANAHAESSGIGGRAR